MNHEHQPGQGPEHDQQPPENDDERSPWNPHEQVGDVYAVDLPADGEPTAELLDADRPRIWAGSWLDYNNGLLHGQWIDADREEADVWTDIQAMLDASPTARETGQAAEDWGIFDHENFGACKPGEQESVRYVTAVARGIREHGPAFAAWADVMEDEEHFEQFSDAYLGAYDSLEAYAEQLVDDLGYEQLLDQAVPQSLRPYVRLDTEGLARDLQLGGDVHALPAENGGVWVFQGDA